MKVIIVGGGQVGEFIGKILQEQNVDFHIVEQRECVLAKLLRVFPEDKIIIGSGAEPTVLEKAGIRGADTLVAVSGADEVNLVASTIAKFEYMVPRVIARVNNPKNEWLFTEKMGVDAHLNQANILAHIVVDEIDLHNLLTLFKLDNGKNSIVRFTVEAGAPSIGMTLKGLQLPPDTLLIGVRRGDIFHIPNGETAIAEGDHVLAISSQESLDALGKLF